MAFGLFGKKPPEKMQAKPAAKPRPATGEPTRSPAPSGKPPTESPVVEADEGGLDLDFTGIQLAEETDPLQAVIEQAAIAYANDHEDEAYAVLAEAVKTSDRSSEGERLWLMLFDLCQVTGNRDGYGALELDYAERFEKQPPIWKESATAAAVTAAVGAATAFRGDLLGGNSAGFDQALLSLEKGPKLRLDLSKVKAADPDGCQRLLDLLARAKKLKAEVELFGLETLGALLEPKIAEEDKNQPYWTLLLEVLQRQQRQEDFDDVALSFAICFEISPPAYEPPPKVVKIAKPVLAPMLAKRADDAFYLEGEVLGGKLDGLEAWLKEHEKAVLDMSGVTRMDFTSAGTLLNTLMPHWQRGLSITLRHPNRLIAELLSVVGIGEVATVILARK